MKRLLLSFVFVALTTSLFAQLPVSFGIKGSINSTKMSSDYSFDDFKSDAAQGFNVGAFARLKFGRTYLQPELLYDIKKGKTTITQDNSQVQQEIKMKSIQIPLLLGVKLIDLKVASINAFTGPAASFLLDKESDFNLNTAFDKQNFNNATWDWQLGGGLDLGMFTLDARYAWALTNVQDGNWQNVQFKNKGNTVTFSLGFRFF